MNQHPDFPQGRLPNLLLNEFILSLDKENLLTFLKTRYIKLKSKLKEYDEEKALSDRELSLLCIHSPEPEEKKSLALLFARLCVSTDIASKKRDVSYKIKKTHTMIMSLSQVKSFTSFQQDDYDKDLLKQVPILDILQIEPKRETQLRATILCPFHEERTPSFVVYKDSNYAICFGCGWKGDVISVVMYVNNVSFREALSILSKA